MVIVAAIKGGREAHRQIPAIKVHQWLKGWTG